MKKFFLFFAAALFCANMSADQAVTINYGGIATQGHFPIYGDNVDSEGHKVQAIYLADQLKAIPEGSKIKSLTFYSANQTQSWGKAEFKVSLAQTDYSYFKNETGAWATASDGSALTTVFDDRLSVSDGELTIDFNTPYVYEGGNLLIQVEVSRAGSSMASSFYSASSDYLIKYAYSGSSREQKQPKVTLVIEDGSDPISDDCHAPTAAKVDAVTDVTASISWEGDASQYQYSLVTEGNQPDWTKATITDQKSVSLSNLYDEQKYHFYVRAYCSETAVSESVKVTFKTACARMKLPWIETFTRDDASSEWTVATPDCWIISSEKPDVFVSRDKTYDEEGNAQAVYTQAHLTARGGGATTAQVFAAPAMNGRLDTLEVAFDYHTNMVSADYGVLEVGYMKDPYKASSFVSIKTLAQTLTDVHAIVTLESVPEDAQFIAFRFAGGTSNYGTVSLDNLVVAGIGKSGDVDMSEEDLPDPSIWSLSYCDAGYTWYYLGDDQYFGMLLLSDDLQDTIAAVFTSDADCTQFASQDGVEFPQDDPNAEHRYYFNTRYILNVDDAGLMKFGAFNECTVNIGGSGVNAQLGLKSGSYTVVVYELVTEYDEETETSKVVGLGDKISSISFTITGKVISNLQAVVAEDHQTATLTWDAPELAQGERVYVQVWSGETVVYDNLNTSDRPESPLTVNVEEGKSYTVVVQVIDKKQNPVGPQTQTKFTVGVNPYVPENPQATVEGGDNVTFSWSAATQADAYVVTLYLDGKFYTNLTVHGTSKTTTTPADGTWSWTVQAFNIGSNGNYFEASNEVAGNDFVTKSAEVPEDAIELNVIGLNAYYIEPNTEWYQEGKNGWVLQFGLDDAGYNYAWFLVYTADPLALSGVYNLTRENLEWESDAIFLDGSGNKMIEGTDSEVRLSFDGYDEVDITDTYSVTQAFFTGFFRLVGTDGKTYVGRFMELMCSSGDFTNYASGNPSTHITLYNEDPSYFDDGQGLEEVVAATPSGKKVLYNNQLLIIRDGKAYNVLGTLVK